MRNKLDSKLIVSPSFARVQINQRIANTHKLFE